MTQIQLINIAGVTLCGALGESGGKPAIRFRFRVCRVNTKAKQAVVQRTRTEN